MLWQSLVWARTFYLNLFQDTVHSDWKRVSVSAKIKKVQIPAIPICSSGPAANGTAQQLFFKSSSNDTIFSLCWLEIEKSNFSLLFQDEPIRRSRITENGKIDKENCTLTIGWKKSFSFLLFSLPTFILEKPFFMQVNPVFIKTTFCVYAVSKQILFFYNQNLFLYDVQYVLIWFRYLVSTF